MRKVGLCAVAISLAMSSLSDTWMDSTTGIEWSYTLSDGAVTIMGAIPAKGALTIPQMINGSAVVGIDANAFKDCGDISSVVLPKGLLGIGEYAFYGCKKIAYLDIPDGCTAIGSWAFSGTGLQRMRIPVSMNNLGGNIFPSTYIANSYTIDWIVSGSSITVKDLLKFDSTFGISCGGVLIAYAEAGPSESFSTITNWGMFVHKYCCKSAYYSQWADCFGAENFLGYLDDDFQSGKSVAVKFSPNDGRDIEAREYQYGQWYGSLPNMSRTGYAFDGWYTAATGGTKLDVHSVVTGGTYYAHWSIKTYKVTFDANGGTCSTSSKSITYGSTIGTLPTPSREKHEFRGWYTEKTGGRKIDASEKVVGNATYYAQWNVLEGQWTDAAGFQWDFSVKNGAVTLTGCKQLSGTGSFVTPFGPTVVIPETIEGCNVTRLGNYLFRGCTKIEKVVVPEGVTGIGAYAFYDCSSMTTVNIPQGVKNIEVDSFRGCSSLATVSIPSGVKSIGDWAFYGCSGLSSVTLPDTVTSIGSYAFENCSSLTSLIVPSSVTSIGGWAFYGCSDLTSVEISSEDTAIGDWAFGNCNGLTTVTMPGSCRLSDVFPQNYAMIKSVVLSDGAKSIAEYAFSGCSGLESVLIPSSVTSIGDNAFAGCSGLRSVEIPGSVTSIGVSAFSDCSNLEAMTIPSGVTRINDNVFAGCSGLTSVVIPKSVTSIGEFAFLGCEALLSVRIPFEVTSIGAAAFSGCSAMSSVMIPPKVANIEEGVFSGCRSLTMVAIPNGVVSIESKAFEGCNGLRAVIIPKSVSSIYNYNDGYGHAHAFSGCGEFMQVYTDEGDVDRIRGLMGTDKCVVYSEKVMDDGIHSEQIFGANWCFEVSGECATIVGVDSADAFVCVPTCLGGAKVTSIGNSVFAERDELSSIAIPLTVTHISEQAFEGCRGLVTVYTGKGDVDRMRGLLVAGGLDLKDVSVCEWLSDGEGYTESVNGVEWTFDVSGGLATVRGADRVSEMMDVPQSLGGVLVARIGQGAFRNCKGLTSVSLPSVVVDIGNKTFEGCTGLKSVEMPLNLLRIGERAFADCYEIASITIPSGVMTVGSDAFLNCYALSAVSIEDLAAWCGIKFSGRYSNPLLYAQELFVNGEAVSQLSIPDNVVKIFDFAFAGCRGARRIVIPQTVREVGSYAFYDCGPKYVAMSIDQAYHKIDYLSIPGDCKVGECAFSYRSIEDTGSPKPMVFDSLRITGETGRGLRETLGMGKYDWLDVDNLILGCPLSVLPTDFLSQCYDPQHIVAVLVSEDSACSSLWFKPYFESSYDFETMGLIQGDLSIPSYVENDMFKWEMPTFTRAGDYEMAIVGHDQSGGLISQRIDLIYHVDGPDVGILPEDKTVFETAQRVSITSSWENAVIHYTVDGSEPTDQSPVFSKFNVTKKTTVKAIAVADGYPWSKTAVAQYGKGKTETPVVTASAGGTYFYSAGNVITMTCSTEGAEIRYTTDGSDPCESSTLYKGPFAITDTTRFRVIACGHLEFVDSPIVEKTFERVWSTVSAPTVSVGSADEGRANEVTITCPTAQATIHYTIDGTDPTAESPVYERAFLLLEGATIKAVAMRDDWKDSPVAERVVAKTWVSGSAVGVDNTFTFASAVPWTIDTAVYREGGSSLRSGEIANGSSTKMVTTVEGDGFVRFWWKASCENDPDYDNWDHACFYVDGEERARIDGMTDWSEVTVQLAGAGRHVLSWVYVKDESATAGDDCVWIDSMAFSPSVTLAFVGKDATSGVAPSAVTSYGGASVALPLPATLLRTGYVFAGWAYGGEIYAAGRTFVVPNGNVTFESCWEPIAYDVVFDANGGSGEMSDAHVAYDENFALPECGYVRDGYEFEGWAGVADGTVLYRTGDQVKNLSCENGAKVMLYAVWSVSVVENPVIAPGDGSSFVGPSCEVSISCSTEGATIYYSAKGTTPRQTDAYKYTAPFVINDTATINAIAVKGDRKSEYVTATITKKTLTLADAVNAPSLTFTTGGVSPWEPIVDSSAAVGTEAARSGAMGPSETADGNMSWMEVSVVGAGTLSFSWKVDCEWDESGACTWDRLMYFVDGADKDEDRIDGFTDWDSKSVTFTSGGTHTVRWVYFKDDYDEEDATCEDCGWVDGVVWAPLTVVEPIPELPSSASADEVRVALEGSADAKLQENITDATVYGQYREWAMKIGAESVKGAANSWISFAVDSAALLVKVPVDGDLKIEEFKPASAEGAFDFTVSVKDVTVGSGATDANLKKVFGLGGTTQLGTEEFDPDKVALEFGTPVNGKLKFTASPKDKTAKSFFMKMKVR